MAENSHKTWKKSLKYLEKLMKTNKNPPRILKKFKKDPQLSWNFCLFNQLINYDYIFVGRPSWWWYRWRDRVARRRRLWSLPYSLWYHLLLFHYCYSAGHHSGYYHHYYHVYWIIVIIILALVLVTGLIIDAFGELRDQLESVKEDMESNCFICGIGKDFFDTVPHGFDTHVQKEHNLANYL